MTCLSTCLPFLPTRCNECPERSENLSLPTFGREPRQTTSLAGFAGSATQWVPPQLSERDGAFKALEIAAAHVLALPNGREKSLALTKIDEAAMWLEKATE